MDWQMIGAVTGIVALVLTAVGLFVALWSARHALRSEREDRKVREAELRRQATEREEEQQRVAREREKEAGERDRKTIFHLVKRLEPHQVLTPELDHSGEYYGSPQAMIDAVKQIRNDLVYAESELGENHKDIPLLQTMTKACNAFLQALEPLALKQDLVLGGPDFRREIEEQHMTFIEVVWQGIGKLRERNDIKS